jgi:hypothetical protein
MFLKRPYLLVFFASGSPKEQVHGSLRMDESLTGPGLRTEELFRLAALR